MQICSILSKQIAALGNDILAQQTKPGARVPFQWKHLFVCQSILDQQAHFEVEPGHVLLGCFTCSVFLQDLSGSANKVSMEAMQQICIEHFQYLKAQNISKKPHLKAQNY